LKARWLDVKCTKTDQVIGYLKFYYCQIYVELIRYINGLMVINNAGCNYSQHNDTQRNGTQHGGTRHSDIRYNDTSIMPFSIIMLFMLTLSTKKLS